MNTNVLRKLIGIIVLILGSNLLLWSQVEEEHDHEEDHVHLEDEDEHVHHDHHMHEIGVANSPVYYLKEKEFSYGLHAHYIYHFDDSKWGIGVGYEKIFDEHEHETWGIVGSYELSDGWSLVVSPGITSEIEDGEKESFLGFHVETTYEFEIGSNVHIGPVLEVAYDPEDIHISLGLHLGFGF